MRNRRRRPRWLLLAPLALGFVLQLLAAVRTQAFTSDSFHYLLIAESLAGGDGFVSGGSQHPDVTRLPVYPALIAAVYLVLRDIEWAGLFVTAAGGALTLVPLLFLSRSLFGRRAVVPAIVLGTVSCILAVSWRILPEAVYLPIALGSAACTWWSARRPSRGAALGAGTLAGLAAVTRAEGLAWILFAAGWSFVDGGPSRGGRPGRWSRLAWTALAAGVIYSAYVGWASARLGRFEPFPEIRYLRLMRDVDDRFGLRDAPGPWMAWSDRARFLLTEDRSAYVLESGFASNSVPPPDPAFRVRDAAADGETPALSSTAGRRLGITWLNSRRVPTVLRELHLVPPVLVGLGALGVVTALSRRRGWRRMGFLAGALAAALVPVMSHVEVRFLFPAFALGLVAAAGGWAWLVGRAERAWPRSQLPALALTVLLGAAVTAAGATHLRAQEARLEEAAMRREAAAWAKEHLGEGPVLALEPGIPFWSGHAYRAIPMGGPDAVLAFARAQRAAAVSFEDPNDLERLPLLEPFRGDPPPGFRLLHEVKRAGSGSVKLFGIEP